MKRDKKEIVMDKLLGRWEMYRDWEKVLFEDKGYRMKGVYLIKEWMDYVRCGERFYKVNSSGHIDCKTKTLPEYMVPLTHLLSTKEGILEFSMEVGPVHQGIIGQGHISTNNEYNLDITYIIKKNFGQHL